MGPPAAGFRLAFDVSRFEATWVLVPGLLLLGLCLALLLVRAHAAHGRPGRRRALSLGAGLLFLAAVWWTLGGLAAWRVGAQHLALGTADFAEGGVEAKVRRPDGALEGFSVSGRAFQKPRDAFAPALHASRWPTLALQEGQRVRVWFFGEDVLRLEVADGPLEAPAPVRGGTF